MQEANATKKKIIKIFPMPKIWICIVDKMTFVQLQREKIIVIFFKEEAVIEKNARPSCLFKIG